MTDPTRCECSHCRAETTRPAQSLFEFRAGVLYYGGREVARGIISNATVEKLRDADGREYATCLSVTVRTTEPGVPGSDPTRWVVPPPGSASSYIPAALAEAALRLEKEWPPVVALGRNTEVPADTAVPVIGYMNAAGNFVSIMSGSPAADAPVIVEQKE